MLFEWKADPTFQAATAASAVSGQRYFMTVERTSRKSVWHWKVWCSARSGPTRAGTERTARHATIAAERIAREWERDAITGLLLAASAAATPYETSILTAGTRRDAVVRESPGGAEPAPLADRAATAD